MDHFDTKYNDFQSHTQRKQYIAAYSQMVTRRMEQGWQGYIMSFMFRQLQGSSRSVGSQMAHELHRVYAKSLTRIVRRPLSKRNEAMLPVWLACPDFPVFKHAKQNLQEITVNGGRHLHAIALIPPEARMREGLDEHFDRHQALYIGASPRLQRIHVARITHDPDYVTAYVHKALLCGRACTDDLLILPRSRSEVDETPNSRPFTRDNGQ